MAKRYIEANALIQDIEQSKANNNHNNTIASQTHNAEHKKFIKMVLEQPTADVVEVKHGEWIDKPSGRYLHIASWCSVCGNKSGIGGIESNRHKPYCPNCGADMRGDSQ